MDDVSQKLGEIAQWQRDHERHDDERFAAMTALMEKMPTKADLDKLASKEDVARLNNIVHNFTLGVQLLSSSGKLLYYVVIGVATLIGAVSIITGGWKMAGAWFISHLGGQ